MKSLNKVPTHLELKTVPTRHGKRQLWVAWNFAWAWTGVGRSRKAAIEDMCRDEERWRRYGKRRFKGGVGGQVL